MSTIHHRDHPATNVWWYGVAAAALVVILLLSTAIANARTGTSVRADTNPNMVKVDGTRPTTYSGTSVTSADSLCSVLRQDALSVELAHSGCSSSHGSGSTAENLCSVLRQDALSVELAHSRCSARRP